jgi:hypothetical protein
MRTRTMVRKRVINRRGGAEGPRVLVENRNRELQVNFPATVKWYRTTRGSNMYKASDIDQSAMIRPGCTTSYERMPSQSWNLLGRRALLVSRARYDGKYCTFPKDGALLTSLDEFAKNNPENFALIRDTADQDTMVIPPFPNKPERAPCPAEAPLSGSAPESVATCAKTAGRSRHLVWYSRPSIGVSLAHRPYVVSAHPTSW